MRERAALSGIRAGAAGFVVMFVINAAVAALVINPLYEEDYPEVTADASVDFAVLIGGYLIIAVGIALLVRLVPRTVDWRRVGVSVGLAVGAVSFFGVHTVQAGYTSLNKTAWILSGLLDVFGPAVAALIMAYGRSRDAHASVEAAPTA